MLSERSMVRAESPQCELLFDLFSGPRGRVHLGRMLQGPEPGRLVALREVSTSDAAALEASVTVARSVEHPKLLKVFGLLSAGGQHYLSSEYSAGISLFELGLAIRLQKTQLHVAAAVRIAIEALSVAGAARALLEQSAHAAQLRYLSADTIWIAPSGQILLAEAGVASPSALRSGFESSADELEAQDVLTLGAELFNLVSGRLMAGNVIANLEASLPAQLADALRRAIAPDGVTDCGATRSFGRALAALPAAFIGTEAQVGAEIGRVMQSVLEARRRTLLELSMPERARALEPSAVSPPAAVSGAPLHTSDATAESEPEAVVGRPEASIESAPPNELPAEPTQNHGRAAPAQRARLGAWIAIALALIGCVELAWRLGWLPAAH
jgi:hypothetical protein